MGIEFQPGKYPADLAKDIQRCVRSAAYEVLIDRFKRPKASRIAYAVSLEVAPAIIDLLRSQEDGPVS